MPGLKQGRMQANATKGYLFAMQGHGIGDRTVMISTEYTEAGGHAAAHKLLDLDPRPTAVVCANDRCAFGLVETLVRAGVQVPGNISVIGFDDSSVARFPFLDLTSVRPDPRRMAALAIDAAERRIEDPASPVTEHRVMVSLAVRSSTGAALRGGNLKR